MAKRSQQELEIIDIGDLVFDDLNANLGTARGEELLDDSLREHRAARSILIDKDGRIIAGNKTAQAAMRNDIKDVVIVRTKGEQLVAVLREDVELDSERGRQPAIADNRIAQLPLRWNGSALEQMRSRGINLDGMFTEREFGLLTGQGEIDLGFADDDDELDGFADGNQFTDTVEVYVSCERDLYNRMRDDLTELLERYGLEHGIRTQ